MSDFMSLMMVLLVIGLVGFGLYAGLKALRVAPKTAAITSGILVFLAGGWVIAFFRAMSHP